MTTTEATIPSDAAYYPGHTLVIERHPAPQVERVAEGVSAVVDVSALMAKYADLTDMQRNPDRYVGADNPEYWQNSAQTEEEKVRHLGSAQPPEFNTGT